LPGLDEPARPTVERLIDLVLGVLPDAQHERKWGRLTFTREADWHQRICAISPTNKAVKLMIHKGVLLADPRGVMEGEGRYSRASPSAPPNISTPTPWRRFCERLPPARRRCDPATVPGGSPYGSSPRGKPAVASVSLTQMKAGVPASAAPTPAQDGGCRIKPSRKCRAALAERHPRAAMRNNVATDDTRAPEEMALFGTHP
jgi:hypothetical protein